MDKNKTKFIRVNGRVVPVKIKQGSGTRGGPQKVAENKKQKIGKSINKVANVAAATTVASFGGMAATHALGNLGKRLMNKTADSVARNTMAATAAKRAGNKAEFLKKGMKAAISLDAHGYAAKLARVGKFAPKLALATVVAGSTSIAASIGALPFAIAGSKQRHKEGVALHQYNKKRKKTGV